MSQRSRYENRAKLITKGIRKEDTLPPAAGRQDAWTRVATQTDVHDFYQLYYPHLPDVLCTAIGDMYARAVAGEITLEDDFLVKKSKKDDSHWDYHEDIKKAKLEGQLNLTCKRLEDMMIVAVKEVPEEEKVPLAVVGEGESSAVVFPGSRKKHPKK